MPPALLLGIVVASEAHLGTFDRTRMAEHVQQPGYAVAPPARLCLQVRRRHRATGDRCCVPPVEPVPLKMGFLHKLFGAHDIRGRGSDVPGCAHADPFFLCDAVRLPRHAKPPFCAHPHSGAGVISLLFRAACTVRPWDNVQGAEAEPLRAGGIYHVDTGAGCVHDEPFDPLSSGETFGGRFDEQGPPIPADGDASWLAQLWYDALPEDENAPPRPVSSAVGRPEDVPVVRDEGLAVRVLVGSYGGVTGPVTAALPLVILHGRVDGAATLASLPPGHNGFIWVLDGALTAGGATLTYGERGLGLLPPGGDRLRLEGAAEFFVGLGPPRRVPHYKYVGYGGGFVSRSVAGVEAAMSEYERDPRAFGRTTAAAPSTDHLNLVGGFQDDDGPMMERPAETVARFVYKK